MTTNQPKWECIGQLGDAHPLDHGGYWVFRDKTGVYSEEAELLITDLADDEGKGEYIVYRFILDRCTFINGILSDNKFHPGHSAWFATPESQRQERPQDTTYLQNIAKTAGVSADELVRLFCSENALDRAQAYRMVGEYHGFDNLDHYPLSLSYKEMKQRYTWHGKLKAKYREKT